MRRLTIVVGLAAILVSGCADGTGIGADGPSATGTVPEPTQPAPTTPARTAPAPTGPTPTATPPSRGPTLVLDGVAEPGVEPGCVVLRAAGKQYLLVGVGGRTLTGVPMRVPIRVRGAVLTGVLSYCQQGTPFQVVKVSRR
jgi:hypothetical protein